MSAWLSSGFVQQLTTPPSIFGCSRNRDDVSILEVEFFFNGSRVVIKSFHIEQNSSTILRELACRRNLRLRRGRSPTCAIRMRRRDKVIVVRSSKGRSTGQMLAIHTRSRVCTALWLRLRLVLRLLSGRWRREVRRRGMCVGRGIVELLLHWSRSMRITLRLLTRWLWVHGRWGCRTTIWGLLIWHIVVAANTVTAHTVEISRRSRWLIVLL